MSLDMYNALEAIVKHEYAMFLEDQSSDSTLAHELKLMDRQFVDGDNLTCEHCGLSYQRETKEKFELFNVSWNHFSCFILFDVHLSSCCLIN